MTASTHGDLPKAVVLTCAGAPEGAVNVVRSLGERGIPVTVISEYAGAPAAASRYTSETFVLPGFTRDSRALAEFLAGYARRQSGKPVLFPTADPDLILLSQLRDTLNADCYPVVARSELVNELTDKRRFAELAARHGFPVPATFVPADLQDLRRHAAALRYPAMIKPSNPMRWKADAIAGVDESTKAIWVQSAEQLVETCERISRHGFEVLIQEYVPGNDPEHFELHVYISREGVPIAWFTGRKHRIYPPHAGSGCFVESVHVKPVIESGIRILRQIGYTGIANLDFKRDARTGEYLILEINPRVSQWNILATRAGVNLPYIAYADAVGLPYDHPPRQKENIRYVHAKNDFKAFLQYRREGQLSWPRYLLSLLRGRTVFQYYATRDLRPFLAEIHGLMHSALRRVAGATLRLVRSG